MILKILITGANGFVGSYAAGYLHDMGHEVSALVRHTAQCGLIPPHIHQIRTDYSPENLAEALSGHEIIIHTAATVRARSWDEYRRVNVELTRKLTDAFNACSDTKHFIFLSSQAAAGMAETGMEKHEDDPCNPITDYGRSKRLAEHEIMKSCMKPWTIIRPSSVYGPGDKDFLLFFQAVQNHVSVHIGNPEKRISLLYVRELAELLNLVIMNQASYQQIFFASDGEIYKQDNFIDTLQQVIPSWTLQLHLPDLLLYPFAAFSELGGFLRRKAPVLNWQKKDEILGSNWVVSIDKAKSLLGFQPVPKLTANLRETYSWYKAKGWL